ncbi:MAG: hypothetical protein M3342_07420 [Bacteroidota bacterium]|nr:hypothetical protein [Flavisolibacter sp.]MDQ3843829.1 hypothetical protein [Bacteroidota bacterium]MBD0284583.1 hypothetical protein [Flavisolibacter sp.]MBD0295176.1 hypothetical protein [Flavisolibacter sp.]MBD0351860.1 hypothetical protein [Flavisolibacter sp.]
MNSWLTVTVGANNAFNVYPDKVHHYVNSVQDILFIIRKQPRLGFMVVIIL